MTSETVRIEFDVIVAVRFDPAEKRFYASSPNINIVREGKSSQKALDMFLEALDIFVQSAFVKGTLDKLMAKSGYAGRQTPVPGDLQVLRFDLQPTAQIFGRDSQTEQGSINRHRYSQITN